MAAAAANGKPSFKALKAAEQGLTLLTPDEFADLVTDYLG